jgi:exonuclease SbcC
LPEDQTTYSQALAVLEEVTRQMEALKIELDSTIARLRTLEANGFESSTLARLQQRFRGADGKPPSAEFIQSLRVANEKKLIELRSDLAKLEEQSSGLRSTCEILLTDCGLELGLSPRQTEEALRQRLSNLRASQNATQSLTSVLTIEPTTPLASIAVALNVGSGAQARLRLAMQSERAADSSIVDAQKALDTALLAQQRTIDAVIRFQVAERALDEVLSVHSLEAVSREVLKQNRAEVASIFERIHAPHEFKVCASQDALLERVDIPEPIKLDQISSGQRAAFALSLFLALNSRATRAPPIMLIDDPVAHVDDLNTLSFLDYLRDLAATGQRQIFFATADEKLAALFTHKLSFLGEQDFKTYELARD